MSRWLQHSPVETIHSAANVPPAFFHEHLGQANKSLLPRVQYFTTEATMVTTTTFPTTKIQRHTKHKTEPNTSVLAKNIKKFKGLEYITQNSITVKFPPKNA
jgi:hypothetical protein